MVFYDGGLPPGDPRPDLPAKIMLERIEKDAGGRSRESFRMLRRIAYRDEEYGEILVPRDPGTFETDFASVPTLLTWLVPRTGAHLPAALIHDGLVGDDDYVAADRIERVAADLVFRRAMRDSYIPFIRRWLVWSAVSLGTIRHGSESWSKGRHLRYLAAAAGSLLLVAALGHRGDARPCSTSSPGCRGWAPTAGSRWSSSAGWPVPSWCRCCSA